MELRYTTEEVRDLVAEGACLNYPAPTARDVDEATDVLEGVEELVAKLPAEERFATLSEVALRAGDTLWIPVAHNCRLSAGVGVEEDGVLSFAVRGEGEDLIPYFAARRAAVHALLNRAAISGPNLPAPEENGASAGLGSADAVVDLPDGESHDILDGGDESGDPEDEILCGYGSDRTEGAMDFALKGLAGDEPSDLAVEGLAHPESVSMSYLGRPRGGVLDVARNESNVAGEAAPEWRTLHPEWRSRLEELRVEGELPEDLIADVESFLDEVGEVDNVVRPEKFLAELARQRGAASLTEGDLDTVKRARRLGALNPNYIESESVARLASAGEAHLRVAGRSGEVLLVPEGVPEERVAEAAKRSRLAAIEARKREGERRKLEILDNLFEQERALSLETVLGRIGGPYDKDFLRRQIRDGRLEARGIEGEIVLCSVGASESVFRRAARLAKRVKAKVSSNRKTAARRARKRGAHKAFAAPVVPFGDEANHLPSESEWESGPDPEGFTAGRSYLDAERRGEAVIGTCGRGTPDPSRTPRQRAAARRRVMRAIARGEARRNTESEAKARRNVLACKAAWREALKVHLASLPTAERLELFLKTGGRREFAELKSCAADPEALERSARQLAKEGRVKVRGRSSGKVYVEAANPLGVEERAQLHKELLEVMALAKPGVIRIPEGTRLARRVAAARKALAGAKTGVGAA